MRVRIVVLAIVLLAAASCSDDEATEQQLVEQEQRIAELEAALEAAAAATTTTTTATTSTTATTIAASTITSSTIPRSTTTTLPQVYIEARETCATARDELEALRMETMTLKEKRNNWNRRRNDYLDGKIADQDELAESAIASLIADDLAVVFGKLDRLQFPLEFEDYVLDLMRFVDALFRETELDAEFVLITPTTQWLWNQWASLIEEAIVAFHEWQALEDRVGWRQLNSAYDGCIDAIEPLRQGTPCEDCLTG